MHQGPTAFRKIRHDVAAAALAVASLRHGTSLDLATIHFATIEDHFDVPTLVDELQIGVGARFCTGHDEQQTCHGLLTSIAPGQSAEIRRARKESKTRTSQDRQKC